MDWFSIETKVRKLVSELVEPTIRRGIDERDVAQKVQTGLDVLKRKVDEIEYTTLKSAAAMGKIDQVFEAIEQFKVDRSKVDQEIRQEILQCEFQCCIL